MGWWSGDKTYLRLSFSSNFYRFVRAAIESFWDCSLTKTIKSSTFVNRIKGFHTQSKSQLSQGQLLLFIVSCVHEIQKCVLDSDQKIFPSFQFVCSSWGHIKNPKNCLEIIAFQTVNFFTLIHFFMFLKKRVH